MSDEYLIELQLNDFLDRLASDAPTPGGGSVAALAGSLAAALGRMACGLTLGRRRFAEVEPQIRRLAERFDRADTLFRRLVDEDAAAYGQLSAVLKSDKSSPDRPGRLHEAARIAAGVPLETATIAQALLSDLAELAPIGNPNLASDVRAATHLASAAVRAAVENVRVNLPFLPDDESRRITAELDHLS